MRFLVKQGIYALAGLVAPRGRSRGSTTTACARSRRCCSSPRSSAASPSSPSALDQRRAPLVHLGPVSLQPSELAKLAVCIWVCAVLSPPAGAAHAGRADEAGRHRRRVFGGLIVVEPDLGTTIALVVMVAGILLVSGIAAAALRARDDARARHRRARDLDGAVPARAAASASSTRGRTRRARASRPCRRSSGSARAGSRARGSARASRRSTSCPRRTPT